MKSAEEYLFNSYVTRGGEIDPWGTIRILDTSVDESKIENDATLPFFLQPGLFIWCEKLAEYSKHKCRASVGVNFVEVITESGLIAEEIPYSQFFVVRPEEVVVEPNGYLFSKPEDDDFGMSDEFYDRLMHALAQAREGKQPDILDNGMFVRVEEKYAGQTLILLKYFGGFYNESALVYTRNGVRIPCKYHYPLSFAKWAPEHEKAAYSRPDPVIN